MNETLLLDITTWLWYDTDNKKPRLQIKILESVALCGRLSVSLAELELKNHHHPEIWHSFKILEKKRLIKKLTDSNPGREKPLGKGRRKIYYAITEKGLFAFIATLADTTSDTVKVDPKKFWRAIIGFCHYNSKQVTLDKVNDFYQLFTKIYFEYTSGHGYFFQLDLFNQMCSKWIEINTISSFYNISLDQKLLEILALNPRITLQELAMKADESEKNVKKVIKEYSSFPNYQPYSFLVHGDEYFDAKMLTEELLNFLQHKILIVRKNSDGNDAFELSLFGIILVLTLVRCHNMNKLNLYLLNSKSISFQDCFDRIIVSNYYPYKKVLPLIFGNWNLLKDILKVLSAYNFDVILDKEARRTLMSSSAIMNGNKEFYDGIKEVALHTRKQLIEVHDAGLDIYYEYTGDVKDNYYTPLKLDYNPITQSTMNDDGKNQKATAVYQKLVELAVLLKYSDPKSLYEELKKDRKNIKSFNNLDYSLYEIEVLQNAFANEITFLYYLNLNQDVYFPALLPQNDYIAAAYVLPNESKIKRKYDDRYSLSPIKGRGLPMSPKERLLEILRQDKEIRDWFSSWIADSIHYQKQAIEAMSVFYNQVK